MDTQVYTEWHVMTDTGQKASLWCFVTAAKKSNMDGRCGIVYKQQEEGNSLNVHQQETALKLWYIYAVEHYVATIK